VLGDVVSCQLVNSCQGMVHTPLNDAVDQLGNCRRAW